MNGGAGKQREKDNGVEAIAGENGLLIHESRAAPGTGHIAL